MQGEESRPVAMAAGLSRKAELLLAVLIRRSGGIVDEYLLRDGTGLSHGSIVAARRELVEGGWLRLGKKERKLVYILTGQGQTDEQLPAMSAPPPSAIALVQADPSNVTAADAAASSCAVPWPPAKAAGPHSAPPSPPSVEEDTGFARLIEPMEHVTGHFSSLDEWTDVLIDTLGGNVDITESLVEDDAYQIHSYDHGCDDCYQVTATDDGILVE
ncbi:MAG: hypothetical protein LKE51_09495 [Selenomonas sp.]|jgi:hypothetical protein|nr:hypothetical protein [Selenomonas sp.]